MRRVLATLLALLLALSLFGAMAEELEGELWTDEMAIANKAAQTTPVEEEEEEEEVYGYVKINEANFPDAHFRKIVKKKLDIDRDGALSVDECIAVVKLDVTKRKIGSLEGIGYFTELETLDCAGNVLTALDLSNNPELRFLDCSDNALTVLDLSDNARLMELNCSDNQLTQLILRRKGALNSLSADGNRLAQISVGSCPLLKRLTAYPPIAINDSAVIWSEIFADYLRIDRNTLLLDGRKLLYQPGRPKTVAFAKKRVAVTLSDDPIDNFFRLAVKMSPNGTTSKCTFTSSNEAVVVWNKDGLETNWFEAVGRGTAVLTVKTGNGKTDKVRVTVY